MDQRSWTRNWRSSSSWSSIRNNPTYVKSVFPGACLYQCDYLMNCNADRKSEFITTVPRITVWIVKVSRFQEGNTTICPICFLFATRLRDYLEVDFLFSNGNCIFSLRILILRKERKNFIKMYDKIKMYFCFAASKVEDGELHDANKIALIFLVFVRCYFYTLLFYYLKNHDSFA